MLWAGLIDTQKGQATERARGGGGEREKVMAAPGESRLRDKVKAAWQETEKSVQEVVKKGGRYCK